jgi:hypothetical protein
MGKPKKVFEFADQVKPFLIQVKHACAWVNENHARFGIDHEVHDSTISRALLGRPVYPGVVDALIELHRLALGDPWSFCEPPPFEQLTEYAPLAWWHDVLKPDVPPNTWNLIKKRPLSAEREAVVRAKYDAWVARLRTACDEHKEDLALVRAFAADVQPEITEWGRVDGVVRRGVSSEHVRFTRRAPYGLHHLFYHAEIKTQDHFTQEAAVARALSMENMHLPDVAKASLGYARPEPSQEDWDWATTMVEEMLLSKFAHYVPRAWNGDSWEYVETWKDERQVLRRYVWDAAAWDYRDEVVGLHKVWVPRKDTGYQVPDTLIEPPEDNRVWVPKKVEKMRRRTDGGRVEIVEEVTDGHWTYPGGDRVRIVSGYWVPGEVIEGYWRDPTEDERIFDQTGLRRLTFDPIDELKETWLANRKKTLTSRDYQPTDDEWEARWVAHRDRLLTEQQAKVAQRDQEIADKLAEISSQPG